VFIDIIADRCDISTILDIFRNGKPNTNHVLIARLAKYGYLKTIVTTNFDLLIERALIVEGLKKSNDFQVFFKEEQFANLDAIDKNGKITILKIHGSIEDLNSIRTTLKSVANKTLSDQRKNLVHYVFSGGNHETIFIMGYSCSDEFDINEQVRYLKDENKLIVLVDHSTSIEGIEDIREMDPRSPFSALKGQRIRYPTEIVVKCIWEYFGNTIGEYSPSRSQIDWMKFVDAWTISLKNRGRHLSYQIAAELTSEILGSKSSIQLFMRSVKLAREAKCLAGECSALAGLAISWQRVGDFQRTITYFNKALAIAERTNDTANEAKCFRGLGNAYYRKGNLRKADLYYIRALKVSKDAKDLYGESVCSSFLGYLNNLLGNVAEALRYNKRSLQLIKKVGAKKMEARIFLGLGISYYYSGNFRKADHYYSAALEISKLLCDKALIASCYTGLGSIYMDSGYHEKAWQLSKEALEISKELGDKAQESDSYINLGSYYRGTGDARRAINFCRKALKIQQDIDYTIGKLGSYIGLGRSYNALKNSGKARMCFENSLKIALKNGYKKKILESYRGLGTMYENREDHAMARKYYDKALKMAILIGDKYERKLCSQKLQSLRRNLQ
jgi:tetratricopeptide (TPR) repeat protein